MSDPRLQLTAPDSARESRHYRQPLGQVLVDLGYMRASDLMTVLRLHRQSGASVARICIAEGYVTEEQVLTAQSLQWGAMRADLRGRGPDPQLDGLLSPEFCRDHAVLPWSRLEGHLVIATARPDSFADVVAHLPEDAPPVMMALASEAEIHAVLSSTHRGRFAIAAAQSVPEPESCREFCRAGPRQTSITAALCLTILAALWFVPNALFLGLILWASGSLFLAAALKFAAFWACRRRPVPAPPAMPPEGDLPTVSIMVPLFNETGMARALVDRLSRLSYPKALLDIVLVLEEDDSQTRATLEATTLPSWMRIIEVPDGDVRTKPRALNYALGFCRGDIIGVYDAEDAPAPDQIDKVVAHFAAAPPEVVCLQGVLDYYNPHDNWLARCFTLEYATWFRVVLPGLARLGLAIPLGGTTVFFRRAALEELHGWDAHNVTEDADLGIRLARYGYRTELVATVTGEEANNRLWPWVRQRSRWLKGYMVTYLVHMRRPAKLWRQLGARKFLGFQLFFLTALSQFLLAPVLWSFWAVPFGLPHPLVPLIGTWAVLALGAAFLLVTAADLCITVVAIRSTAHRGLVPWVPTMLMYFPLATAAAYKAIWELAAKPFYWDKTAHGHSLAAGDATLDPATQAQTRSASEESSFSRVTKATEM